MLAVTAISFLLLSTVYFMAPLSSFGSFSEIDHHDSQQHNRGSHKKDHNHKFMPKMYGDNGMVYYDKYDIYNNSTLEKFMHRKVLPPLEPRMVRLTDKNHSFRFAFPPGAVSATASSSSSFPFSEFEWKLKSRYVELRRNNPKAMSEPESLYKDNCVPLADWQVEHRTVCNTIHEMSAGWQQFYRMPTKEKGKTRNSDEDSSDDQQREQIRLVNQGAFRHVWMIRDGHDGMTKRAMKTLRAVSSRGKTFDLRNDDRHRRDAMSFEMLQESPLVVDIYAACSNTAIFDYADGGDLLGIFDDETEDKTPEESEKFKLHIMEIAYNVSLSIHDAHHFDSEGRATIAHTDIKTNQFIYEEGYYKLSDFNRVRFLTYNPKTKDQCGFRVGKNGGEYRSPEEYAYKLETEKVDVYSLGNVLYFLLVQEEVFEDKGHKEVYDLVKAGKRPMFPDHIYKSDGIFERYMIKAIESAWIHRPAQRPSALEVANIIKEGIELKKKA